MPSLAARTDAQLERTCAYSLAPWVSAGKTNQSSSSSSSPAGTKGFLGTKGSCTVGLGLELWVEGDFGEPWVIRSVSGWDPRWPPLGCRIDSSTDCFNTRKGLPRT